jgi:hypothetical protein
VRSPLNTYSFRSKRPDPVDADAPYPIEMTRALIITWLFAGLRRNEIVRLRVGCIRWQKKDEGTLSRLQVEVSVILAAGRSNGRKALRETATAYKVDTDAIALKVKQEFAAKEKAKKEPKPKPSVAPKNAKAG